MLALFGDVEIYALGGAVVNLTDTLHDFVQRDARGGEQGDVRVAEHVGRDARRDGRVEQGGDAVDMVLYVGVDEWIAIERGGRENEVVLGAPVICMTRLFDEPARAPGAEHGADVGGNIDRAAAADRLGRVELVVAGAAAGAGERLGDADHAAMQVDVIPAQGESLADAHAGKGEQGKEGVVAAQAVLAGGGEETLELIALEETRQAVRVPDRRGGLAWRADVFARVGGEHMELHRAFADHAHHAVDAENGIDGETGLLQIVQALLIEGRRDALQGELA